MVTIAVLAISLYLSVRYYEVINNWMNNMFN